MATLDDQLSRLAERGPAVDPRFVVRHAVQAATDDHDMLGDDRAARRGARRHHDVPGDLPAHRRSPLRQHRVPVAPRTRQASRRRVLTAAAAVALLVAGAAGAYSLVSRSGTSGGGSAPAASPGAPPVPPAPTTGPLLTTALAAGTRPLISVGEPGWTVTSYSGFDDVPQNETTADCAGCAIPRLVLAADGPLFAGAIFTAWIYDGVYEYPADAYHTSVTIGGIEGRSDGPLVGGSYPADHQLTELSWPIGDGRTAFVEAFGLAGDTVVQMATTLSFDASTPAIMPPAGFSIRTSSATVATEHVQLTFTNGDRQIVVTAANAGIQGLLDWRSPGGTNPMASGWEPRTVDGATIAFFTPTPEGPPTNGVTATWIAGDWSYDAIGYHFGSDDEFLSAVAGLRAVDDATFQASVAGVELTPIENWYDQ